MGAVSWQHIQNKFYLRSKPCSCTLHWANAGLQRAGSMSRTSGYHLQATMLAQHNPKPQRVMIKWEEWELTKFPQTGPSTWVFPVRVGLAQHPMALIINELWLLSLVLPSKHSISTKFLMSSKEVGTICELPQVRKPVSTPCPRWKGNCC